MAADKKGGNKGEWSNFVLVVLLVAAFAAMAFLPLSVLTVAWQEEQEQMIEWAGDVTNHWILAQSAEIIEGLAKAASEAAGPLGNSAIEKWAVERAYAVTLWGGLLTYRVFSLMMWSLFGIPLILAASADGFYVREIRKTSFVSQSPIRHKIGQHFSRIVMLIMACWLCLPVRTPVVVAPMVILFMAVSMWLWVSNLQKRL